MDRTVWSSVAQVVGSIGIVVTLIYLSLQVRRNTAAMLAAARESAAKGDVDWLYKLVNHPKFRQLFR